ncbi:MAG: hypothetical protein JWL97_3660 [Gemmatimonadales bacterium]|nr:hypothetical protein [Gemmatimonadales bacterium]
MNEKLATRLWGQPERTDWTAHQQLSGKLVAHHRSTVRYGGPKVLNNVSCHATVAETMTKDLRQGGLAEVTDETRG